MILKKRGVSQACNIFVVVSNSVGIYRDNQK